jgi:hypothetical protein
MSFEREKQSARTLALYGDHSNYTFEQAGYNTAGRDLNIQTFFIYT